MRRDRVSVRVMLAAVVLAAIVVDARAQVAPAIESIAFEAAVRRAIASNPTIQQAAAGILRAEALLQQTRATYLPSVNAVLTDVIIEPVQQFAGQSIVPRSQLNAGLALRIPVIEPVRWAERNQAGDQVGVSQRSADDVRRQVGVAAAQAYLAIITERRVLELNERARDNAKAHFDYARQRYEGGLGSRLDALRAERSLSSDEARVEEARLAVRRAQEALGVLVASDVPVDAAGEPTFEVVQDDVPDRELIAGRTDLRLFAARESAAARVLNDSWREYLPTFSTLFAPTVLAPAGLFAPQRSYSFSFVGAFPIFESGERRGRQRERRALLDGTRAERINLERLASSEVRTAREAVRSTERSLERARNAAQLAAEVLRISDVAFREGATTNLEVIDAQREARDAETAAAIAEDAVRRARLDLLVATGLFPQ